MRIFLDANVLFSAAKTDGAVRQLLRTVMDAGHECWIDPYVEAEARRNLLVKAPTTVPALDALLAECHLEAFRLASAQMDAVLSSLPEKDRPVLAASIRARCEVLVTGDRTHFGSLYGKRMGGVKILSPAMLGTELSRRR